MTTSLQVEANQRNALRSCGPRSPQGKARSCLNAVTHGLTARTLILPGEDPAEFAQLLAAWTADLQPCNPFEENLVRQAVGHSWRLERADWLEVERLSQRITAVPLEEARRRREEVAELGRRLMPVPSGDHAARPEPDRRAGPDDPDDPARLLSRLESTGDGCRWLLDRWAEKRRAPEAGRAWSPAEMVEAIRLLGKRPLEDLDDRRVLSVVLACFALDRQRPDPFAALWDGLTDCEVQRCRERLLERGLAAAMPRSKDEGAGGAAGGRSTRPSRSSDRRAESPRARGGSARRYRRISCRSTRAARVKASGDIRSGRPGRSSASPIGSARRGAKGSRWLRTPRPRPPARR